MARAGMATLIQQLRALGHAGTNDYTVGDETYWTDDQLQALLDETREQRVRVDLTADPIYNAGDWEYYDYVLPAGRWVEEAGTSGAFVVRDSDGDVVSSSNYSVNYRARRITFTSDQDGAIRTADYRTYNLYRAAARLWDERAAYLAQMVDWSSDNHDFKANQEYRAAVAQAAKYRGMAGITVGIMVRTDEAI